MPVMTCKIDLDEIYTEEEWSTTVGGIIRDEIKHMLKGVVKKELKAREGYIKAVTKTMSKKALEDLKVALGDK